MVRREELRRGSHTEQRPCVSAFPPLSAVPSWLATTLSRDAERAPDGEEGEEGSAHRRREGSLLPARERAAWPAAARTGPTRPWS